MNQITPHTAESRILIVGSGLQDSLENMYLRAFRKCGLTNVTLLDINKVFRGISSSRIISRLTRQLRYHASGVLLQEHLRKNIYDVIIVFKGMQLSPAAIIQCKTSCRNAVWVNINPDDPFNIDSPGSSNANILSSIHLFDHYCIWSKSIAAKLLRCGCSSNIYLPFGYDEEYHRLPQKRDYISHQDPTISFVGSWDMERENILSTLAHHGLHLQIFGNNWHRVARNSRLKQFITNKNIFGDELANVTANSAISLNMLRPQNMNSHNMRTFEIPAMGGLMLTNRTEEQQDFLPEDEACYMYGTVDELVAKINYIMVNGHEAWRVRARGIELVKSHSYTNRVQFFLKELGC